MYLMFDIYQTNPIWFLMKHPSSAFQQYLIPKIGWKLLKSPFWWDSRKENSGTQGGTHRAKLPVAGEVFSLGILRLFVVYRYFCIKLVLTQFAILEEGCKSQIACLAVSGSTDTERRGPPSPALPVAHSHCGHSCSHSSVLGRTGHGDGTWGQYMGSGPVSPFSQTCYPAWLMA